MTTVAELIKALSKFDPGSMVYSRDMVDIADTAPQELVPSTGHATTFAIKAPSTADPERMFVFVVTQREAADLMHSFKNDRHFSIIEAEV